MYKTHKERNPIRLLTTSCNTAIENLSRLIEKNCAPLSNNIDARIINTKHLLQIIDNINANELPNDTILVSFDIVNMFPNIDNIKDIETVKLVLQNRPSQKPSTERIIEGIKICLYNKSSKFDQGRLLQTNGTATGAPNSCSYSDLATHRLDKLINNERINNFSELFFYGRYRDDCYVIWNGNKERLNSFHQLLNSLDENLKFTTDIAKGSLCFLDLKISIVDCKLVLTVYSKPTDSHLYLQSNSCYNPKAIDRIQKAVALRIKRICSSEQDYLEKLKGYMAYLLARGHSPKKVKGTFENVGKITRTAARVKKQRVIKENAIIFPAEYNSRVPDVNAIIKRYEHILQHNTVLKELFPKNLFIVGNKRAKNLRELVARADPYNMKMDLLNQTDHGYKKWGRKCNSCNNFILEKTAFVCFAKGTKFKICRASTCNKKNVIYLAFCKKCNKQDVGSCVEWKTRLRNYKC